jgi:excisionase family DNA binding protein
MTPKDIFTAGEIAAYLRIHPYTVKRLARAGKLPGFKIGGQWRFDAQEIAKWKKGQRKEE